MTITVTSQAGTGGFAVGQFGIATCQAPDASFTGLAGPYCADAAAVTLTPTTAGGMFSGPGVSGSTFTPASAPNGGSITYTITVDGCTSSSSQNVTVNPLPTVDAGADKSVVLGYPGPNSSCTPLTAVGSGGSYSWNPGGQSGSPITVCPQQTTTYTVTVTDGNGCMATDQVIVNVKDVRCGPKLNMVSICYYGVTQCVSEKIAKNYLKLGATLGACGSASSRTGYEPATTSLPLTLSLNAYPNPATDALTVEVQSPVAGVATFEVLDVSGRARQSRQQELVEGVNQVEFRLGSLPTGLYLIRAVDALGQQATVRVSKQ